MSFDHLCCVFLYWQITTMTVLNCSAVYLIPTQLWVTISVTCRITSSLLVIGGTIVHMISRWIICHDLPTTILLLNSNCFLPFAYGFPFIILFWSCTYAFSHNTYFAGVHDSCPAAPVHHSFAFLCLKITWNVQSSKNVTDCSIELATWFVFYTVN